MPPPPALPTQGRRTAAVVLAATLAAAGCAKVEQVQRRLFDTRPPRERYEAGLEAAGLGTSALVRDWLAAGERALADPPPVSPPHVEEGFIARAEVAAFAVRVAVRRGQEVTFTFDLLGDTVSQVFLDAWHVADSAGTLRRVASADSGSRVLAFEPRREGTYVLRAQPEILRGERFTLGVRLVPTLAFPVLRGTNDDIGGAFGAPREGGARSHQGIDIFARRGTPALAASDAVVRRVGENGLGGLTVWLRDDRGNGLYYAHLDSQAVREGQVVRRGDTVGFVGNTGNARRTPPHLHFGVFRRGEGPLDPTWFVRRLDGAVPRLTADTGLLGRRGTLTRSTDLLEAPAAGAAARGPLPRNTDVLVLAATSGWYRVRLDGGITGFVRAGRVRPTPADTAGAAAAAPRLAGRGTGGPAAAP